MEQRIGILCHHSHSLSANLPDIFDTQSRKILGHCVIPNIFVEVCNFEVAFKFIVEPSYAKPPIFELVPISLLPSL